MSLVDECFSGSFRNEGLNEMSVQNLPDSVLQELTYKRNDLFLAGLRHMLIDVELVALIMDLGMLAVHAEIERRRQEQQRASHIDEVLQTVCNENVEVVEPQGMDNGLRAVIGRMYEVSKEMREERLISEEPDTRPQAAMPYPHPDDLPEEGEPPVEYWPRAEVTDLGALDLSDEPF